MKIIFAGSPAFSVPVLKSLAQAHDVCLVITQPDKPSGRGKKLTEPPVKLTAKTLNIPVHQPPKINCAESRELILAQKADLMVVSAYGQFIPEDILYMCKHDAWNIHASILPRWRGAAPIEYAILHGDERSGISIMKMEKSMDSGPVILTKTLEISGLNRIELTERLSALAPEAMLEAIPIIPGVSPEKQNEKQVTFCPKIQKNQLIIDWHSPAENIYQQTLAFYPKCTTFLSGKNLKIIQASLLETEQNKPGEISISSNGLVVGTGSKDILIDKLQIEGKRAMDWKEFVNGLSNLIKPGLCLGK